jgi:hypothetical protein
MIGLFQGTLNVMLLIEPYTTLHENAGGIPFVTPQYCCFYEFKP